MVLALCLPSSAAWAAWPPNSVRPLPGAGPYTYIGVGDLDGDGATELVTADGQALEWSGQGFTARPLGPSPVRLVAIADLDGEGHPDLVEADGWWERVGATFVHHRVASAAIDRVGDVDGDGDPDLASRSGHWIENDGTPGLGRRHRTPPFEALVDADGDAAADFVVRSGGTLQVFRNVGGRGEPSGLAIPDDGGLLVVADFDGDGADDVLNLSGGALVVTPVGAGGFGASAVVPGAVPTDPSVSDSAPLAGDLDLDGDTDLSWGAWWFEQTAAGLQAAAPLVPGLGLGAIGDLDDDGDLDLAGDGWWYRNPGAPDADGDGLSDAAEAAWGTGPNDRDSDNDRVPDGEEARAGASPTDPTDADRDGDLLPDDEERALGTNPLLPDSDHDGLWDAVEVAIGTDPVDADTDADGFGDADEVACGSDPTGSSSFDTDCDGADDLAELALGTDALDPDTDGDHVRDGLEVALGTDPLAADSDGGGTADGAELWRGGGPRTARDDWAQHRIDATGATGRVALGDWDGDGDLDVVAHQWLGARPGGFEVLARLTRAADGSFGWADTGVVLGGTPRTLRAADLDGDGLDDLLVDGAWLAGPLVGAAPVALAGTSGLPADVDGDGDVDVVSDVGGEVAIEENAGGGTFAPPRALAALDPGTRPGVGDVDADGDADVLLQAGGEAVWLENTGGGGFAAPASLGVLPGSAVEWQVVDLDRDGVPEVVVDTDGAPWVLDGGGATALATAGRVLAGDVDGLGDLDRVTLGAGRFTTWTPARASAEPRALGPALADGVLVDFDGDGDLDVLGARDAARGDTVVWFENALRP